MSFSIATLSDIIAFAVVEFIRNWSLVLNATVYDLLTLHTNYNWTIGLQCSHKRRRTKDKLNNSFLSKAKG